MFARLYGLKAISPAQLNRLVQGEVRVAVVDVNAPQSWNRAHVPGAVNLGPHDFRESDLPTDKDATLVFYCSNPMCRKAPTAGRRAKKMGYSDVHVMSAGISGWLAARLPNEARA
jgi:rhodanese-related sulfurtransferase